MGILTIQFGQCGNQIGHTLYDYLVKDITEVKNLSLTKSESFEYKNLTNELWFSEYKNSRFTPRSILVDTENKVVSSLINCNDYLKFNNIIAKTGGGSANNWGFGYTLKADDLIDEVLNTVRKEVENSNNITHILNFLSSGGGTGSGTGSRVIELLRSEYPNKIILNVIVLPYKNGEIVTQNYNTILTLAKLYDITDGSILIENDSMHKICNSLLSIKNVDLLHINKVIAQKICAVFQPAINYTTFDFVQQLTSHPTYKFIQIKTTPHIPLECIKYETLPTWSTLIGHMRKALYANNQLHWEFKNPVSSHRQQPVTHHCKSVASLLISRGGVIPEKTVVELLRDKELYPVWVNDVNKLKHFHQPRNLYETENFLTLASNNNSIVNTLDLIVDQAWTLFKHKAYLHQYLKYEVSETYFEIAFEKIESILNNYKGL